MEMMKQCVNGHFYDPSKYPQCPYCDSNKSDAPNVIQRSESNFSATKPLDNVWKPAPTPDDDGHTVAIAEEEQTAAGMVVGWVVCIEGPDKGKSYEIHEENNYVGRAANMDICIPNDRTISRDKPMVISYDKKTNSFYCALLGGKAMARLNGEPLLAMTKIKKNDVIELGKTRLMLVPLCDEFFSWND